MFNVTRLITAAEGDRERLLSMLRTAASQTRAAHAVVAPTLPGSRNGGDILVHLRYAERSQWDTAAARFTDILEDHAVGHVDGATYSGSPASTGRAAPATVYRTLLLRVAPGTDAAVVACFEADLALMPRYVRSIVDWQLSPVESAVGASPWTHVFEQHFTDVDGLMGPYLMHPIHWAYVDRWFDPECPEAIVRDRICHSFCPSE
ncbi:Dabb family protein [Mycolicibacterium holsaticum]|uniref:Stress responsive protein n=1 Tax=Mycolicibacterium holsaticum TaxID=152142 RepID=A0A1E3R4Z3_9MYCO|nr:Dabb family protein [Mycolicibacterium holsaticum]ODQ84985.1 stress responsive protein [Mycolicibacterium holsaticum]